LEPGTAPFDQDQAALDVGLHHAQIERGDAIDAHVAGHLLVLEGLAGILTPPVEPIERCETDTPWVARSRRNSSASCRRQNPCRPRCR
jgi:hypothetical protein